MFNIVPVEKRESLCYEYFNANHIKNREQLKVSLKTNPIQGVRPKFAEDIFVDYLDKERLKAQRKAEREKASDVHTTFTISDIHIPFQDEKSLDLVLECIVEHQPQQLVLCGDILDCYSISRFDKNPEHLFRNLQDEIDVFYKIMKSLKKETPNMEVHYILGNHEARISAVVRKEPGLFRLNGLSIPSMFRLDELDIEYHDTKYVDNGFIYYHGDVVRKSSGYSAKAEYEDHRMKSGVSGHTHRLSSYYSTYEQQVGKWFENGCLCNAPEYMTDPDKANWQQGFTVVERFADGQISASQVLIENHRFRYNGKTYK